MEGVSFETTPYLLASKISKKLAEKSMVAKVIYLNKEKSPFEAGSIYLFIINEQLLLIMILMKNKVKKSFQRILNLWI